MAPPPDDGSLLETDLEVSGDGDTLVSVLVHAGNTAEEYLHVDCTADVEQTLRRELDIQGATVRSRLDSAAQ